MFSSRRLSPLAAKAIAAALLASAANLAHAASGTWTLNADAYWGDINCWANGNIANGANAIADFSTVNITADRDILLDTSRTIGVLSFGDTSPTNDWNLAPADYPGETLTFSDAGGTAAINVNNRTAWIGVALLGNVAVQKNGAGNLALTTPAAYTGATGLNQGNIISYVDNALPVTTLSTSSGTTLDLNAHKQQFQNLNGPGVVTNSNAGVPSTLEIDATSLDVIATKIQGNINPTFSGSTIDLLAANTYTGATIASNTTLVSYAFNALPATTTLTLNTGTFDLNGHLQSLSYLSGNGTVTNSDAVNGATLILTSTLGSTIINPIAGNLGLAKEGPATTVLSGPLTYTGFTSVDAGTLYINHNASLAGFAGTGQLTLSGGTNLTSDGIAVSTVSLLGSAHLTIRTNGTSTGTSFIRSLQLAGSNNAWISTIDITNNKLILEDGLTHAASLATLQNQVAYGRSHSGGIISSTLPANFGLAVLDNALLNKSTFGGQTVDPTSILLAPELLGDANADGHVDLTDLSTILNNFGSTTSAWTSGNFDGAQTIGLTDLSDVLNNFGLTNPSAFSGQPSALSNAPEPASLGVLMLATPMIVRRKRSAPARSDN